MKNKILSFIILLVFAILAYIILQGRINELKNIFQINLKYLIFLFFLTLFRPFLKGLRLKIMMERYDIRLLFKEWFGLTILTVFGNYITPFRAGVSARAVYLKKKHKFSYTSSVSLIGALYLTHIFISCLIGFFLIFFIPFPDNFKSIIMGFFLTLFLISTFILFFIPLPIRMNMKIFKYLTNALSEFRKIRDIPFMLKIILVDVSRLIIEAIFFYSAFKAFGFNALFAACMLMVVFSNLSLILSVTPVGLGVKEALIILTSKLIGADVLIGTFVAVLHRGIAIIIILFLAPIFGYLLLRKETKMVKK